MFTGSTVRIGRAASSPWGLGLLLFAMCALWSLAMPLMASPDEPSHVIKAAAVARGQVSGEVGPAPLDGLEPGAPTFVEVPNDIAAASPLPECFRFNTDEAADCQAALPARTSDPVRVATYAGQYPPLYYALVGWPSLFLQGETALYGMRLVSAALCAGLFTWGLRRFRWAEGSGRALIGAVIALTPMCFFIAGTVNPNGLEIAAAFAFWSAVTALATRPGPLPTRYFVQATVSGALLINTRTSGPVWALVIVVVVLVFAAPANLRALARERATRWLVAVALVASGVAVGWLVTHQQIVSSGDLFPEYANPRLTAVVMLLSLGVFTDQMVGNFGWLDTSSPYPTVIAWTAAASTLVLLTLAVPAARRRRVALVGLIAAVVLVPIALQIPTAQAVGIVWQGRYTLPIALGVPILAALTFARVTGPLAGLVDRLFALTLILLTAAHVGAFYWAARRYSTGNDGVFATFSPEWSSPIGFLPAVLAYLLLVSGLAWLAWRAGVRQIDALTPEQLAPAQARPPQGGSQQVGLPLVDPPRTTGPGAHAPGQTALGEAVAAP